MMEQKQNIVLMYHGITSASSLEVKGREDGASLYDVEEKVFEEHLCLLKAESKIVELTFDDGEENNCGIAFPLLKKHQLCGLFFFIVDRVGQQGYCNWTQILEMKQAGMLIGSHGLTHQILTRLNRTELLFELKESKRILEEKLGEVVELLSIPRGFYNREVIDAALQCGYKKIYISDKNDFFNESCVERVAVKNSWDRRRFEMALCGCVSLKERLVVFVIKMVKKCCGERIYNKIRKTLLKMLGRI